MGFKMISESI